MQSVENGRGISLPVLSLYYENPEKNDYGKTIQQNSLITAQNPLVESTMIHCAKL